MVNRAMPDPTSPRTTRIWWVGSPFLTKTFPTSSRTVAIGSSGRPMPPSFARRAQGGCGGAWEGVELRHPISPPTPRRPPGRKTSALGFAPTFLFGMCVQVDGHGSADRGHPSGISSSTRARLAGWTDGECVRSEAEVEGLLPMEHIGVAWFLALQGKTPAPARKPRIGGRGQRREPLRTGSLRPGRS